MFDFRTFGSVLEVCPSRGTIESLRSCGIPRNGLSHIVHKLTFTSSETGFFSHQIFYLIKEMYS